MNTHRTLVRSSVIAAMAGAALPMGVANAETTLYATAPAFESGATDAGLVQKFVETFEENTLGGGYAMLGPSLSYGVANGPFPTGLDAEGLTVRSVMNDQLVLNAPAEVGYFPNLTSYVVGTNSGFDRTGLDFEGGVRAVGLIVTGIDTFIGGYPEEVGYEIFDMSGTLIATGTWPTPTAETGAFFGVVSTEAIGSIELNGRRFGADEVEIVDDIQGWIDDEPALPGDTNGDGFVNVDDLNNVILDWGGDGSLHGGDVTGPVPGSPPDGFVDVNDLNAVIVNWS